jgi:hypothetical protein
MLGMHYPGMGKKAVIAITLLAILFFPQNPHDTQAASRTFIIAQGDCWNGTSE